MERYFITGQTAGPYLSLSVNRTLNIVQNPQQTNRLYHRHCLRGMSDWKFTPHLGPRLHSRDSLSSLCKCTECSFKGCSRKWERMWKCCAIVSCFISAVCINYASLKKKKKISICLVRKKKNVPNTGVDSLNNKLTAGQRGGFSVPKRKWTMCFCFGGTAAVRLLSSMWMTCIMGTDKSRGNS